MTEFTNPTGFTASGRSRAPRRASRRRSELRLHLAHRSRRAQTILARDPAAGREARRVAAYLETGTESPVEQGVADAGLEYATLTAAELRAVQGAADGGAREERREAEKKRPRKRLEELGG